MQYGYTGRFIVCSQIGDLGLRNRTISFDLSFPLLPGPVCFRRSIGKLEGDLCVCDELQLLPLW